LVCPLSLRNILQPAHLLGACHHPILVPHQNHPEMLLRLKDLITMNYFLFYTNKPLDAHRNTMSQ